MKSVQIIRLNKHVEGEYRFDYTVVCQISDYTEFVNRLNELEHSKNRGDPQQMYVGYVVIIIDYLNGDFDLLRSDAQCFNRSGENEHGFLFFDDAQFGALISDYVAD